MQVACRKVSHALHIKTGNDCHSSGFRADDRLRDRQVVAVQPRHRPVNLRLGHVLAQHELSQRYAGLLEQGGEVGVQGRGQDGEQPLPEATSRERRQLRRRHAGCHAPRQVHRLLARRRRCAIQCGLRCR
jgi:hypothetical protein